MKIGEAMSRQQPPEDGQPQSEGEPAGEPHARRLTLGLWLAFFCRLLLLLMASPIFIDA